MTTAQYQQYQQSLLTYIEVREVVKTAELDVQNKIATKLKKLGVSFDVISASTGLSEQEIDAL